jgi:hypothetical protein
MKTKKSKKTQITIANVTLDSFRRGMGAKAKSGKARKRKLAGGTLEVGSDAGGR